MARDPVTEDRRDVLVRAEPSIPRTDATIAASVDILLATARNIEADPVGEGLRQDHAQGHALAQGKGAGALIRAQARAADHVVGARMAGSGHLANPNPLDLEVVAHADLEPLKFMKNNRLYILGSNSSRVPHIKPLLMAL